MEKSTSLLYKTIRGLVKLFYPQIEVVGAEKLPDEPFIVVGNHCQINGPIACELYFPGSRYIWCAGQMMHLKEVPAYAFQDFWSKKPKRIRWFYRFLSYIIAPFSVCVFNNAHTVPVYRDARLMTTFRTSIEKLEQGSSLIIFPEHDKPYNNIICEFQDKFIDIVRLHYKKTGKEACFVPLYLAPDLRQMHIGEAIRFNADAPIKEDRQRICSRLMAEITSMAYSLPEHKVVPYNNVPKMLYLSNIPGEANENETTCC